MKQLFKQHINLIIIILLAFFLRIFLIDIAPPRLTHDEMSIGYNAYSILKTGKDEWGNTLPLDFIAFGDHKLPGYIYSAVPFIALFGMTITGLKLPSILAGTIAVLIVYLIALKLTKNKTTANISALIFATSPWSIHISRMAFESNLAMAYFMSGIYFLLDSYKPISKKKAILSAILIALSGYTYIAYRMISILFVLLLPVITKIYKKDFKIFKVFLLSFIIAILPLATHYFSEGGLARFNQVSVFSDQGIESKITENRNFCFLTNPTLLPKVCKLLINKPIEIAMTVGRNYISFLLPTFLFLTGEPLEYLGTPGYQQFYIILSLFYLYGLFSVLKMKSFTSKLILILFVLAPIPSALSGVPQIVRGSLLLPLITIFAAIGVSELYLSLIKYFKRYKLLISFSLISLVFILTFRYFLFYSVVGRFKYQVYYYQMGKEVADYINQVENNYSKIYITNKFPDAHILLAFYNKFDPTWYQENIERPNPDDFGFSHPSRLDKYYFGGDLVDQYICDDNDNNTLFLTSNYEINVSSIQTINGSPRVVTVPIGPTMSFKDISNVHTQVQVYDTKLVREYMKEKGVLEAFCPNFK